MSMTYHYHDRSLHKVIINPGLETLQMIIDYMVSLYLIIMNYGKSITSTSAGK
jgi:hypothetical protein